MFLKELCVIIVPMSAFLMLSSPENVEYLWGFCKIRQAVKSKKAPAILLKVLPGKKSKLSGSIYHRMKIDLTYNSNHIEGSRLTHEQTCYIFETSTIGITDEVVNVKDIVEAANPFCYNDRIIDSAGNHLSERFIK